MIGQMAANVASGTLGLGQQGLQGVTGITTTNHPSTWGSYTNTQGTNESMDINDWSQVELQNFVKWFIEVNYPEAVQQYQAIRAIERNAEKAKELEYEMARSKLMEEYYKNQMHQAQNAYQFQNYGQAITIADNSSPKKESIWDAMKRMAGVK